jgi:methylthioribose-1-phosphate isomerase
LNAEGVATDVELYPTSSPIANPAFDVTPARYVSGLITEHGVTLPTREALGALRRRLVE